MKLLNMHTVACIIPLLIILTACSEENNTSMNEKITVEPVGQDG